MGKGNDFWLDDPEWELLRRKAEKRPIPKKLKQQVADQRPKAKIRRDTPRATANREDTPKEVVVNLKLALPKIKPPDFKQLFLAHKQTIIKLAVVVLVALSAFGAFRLISARKVAESPPPSTPQEEAEAAFTPLVPLEDLKDGTGQRSEPAYKYDNEKKVLAYSVNYNRAKLIVSQQALPDQLKTNPGQLEGIARSLQANSYEPVETQKGMAYIATDDESQTQAVVFATEEVLVFIRANAKIDVDQWKFYINQLNPNR